MLKIILGKVYGYFFFTAKVIYKGNNDEFLTIILTQFILSRKDLNGGEEKTGI
jgi:hypothetical protein